MLLGVAGAFLAGYLGKALGYYNPGDAPGFIASILGAMALLLVYRLVAPTAPHGLVPFGINGREPKEEDFMLLAIAIPIGFTLGAATWALMRGPGGAAGCSCSMLFATIGAFIGGLAAQAMVESDSNAAIGIGAAVGGVAGGGGGGAGVWPSPEARWLTPTGRASRSSQPDTGEAAKTIR